MAECLISGVKYNPGSEENPVDPHTGQQFFVCPACHRHAEIGRLMGQLPVGWYPLQVSGKRWYLKTNTGPMIADGGHDSDILDVLRANPMLKEEVKG